MSVYMVICLPERGAYYPTFALAHALQAQGHTVLYPGLQGFKDDVERQGLTFLTLFSESAGTEPDVGEIPHNPIKRLLYYRKTAQQSPKRFHLLEAITNGEFEALIRRHQVDVVLLDSFLSILAPACRNANVPVIAMTTELLNYKNFAIPPNFVRYTPTGTAWSRLVSYAFWGKHLALTYVKRVGIVLIARLLFPRPPSALRRKAKQLEKKARLRWIFSEYSWRADLPEIVLCPRAFDFPNASPAGGRRYFGVTVDPSRVEIPLDHEIPPDKKLVYASLGTHAALYGKRVDRFTRLLIDVARARPDCYFLINIGKGNDPAKFEEIPENVLLKDFVPQLQVLARSAAIITNGGLGTVKEAIMAEVPLLLAPCRWDSAGNAARVKFHGIGEHCYINKVTAAELGERLERLLTDGRYRTQLARLRRRILEDDEFAQGVQWLIGLAGRDLAPSS